MGQCCGCGGQRKWITYDADGVKTTEDFMPEQSACLQMRYVVTIFSILLLGFSVHLQHQHQTIARLLQPVPLADCPIANGTVEMYASQMQQHRVLKEGSNLNPVLALKLLERFLEDYTNSLAHRDILGACQEARVAVKTRHAFRLATMRLRTGFLDQLLTKLEELRFNPVTMYARLQRQSPDAITKDRECAKVFSETVLIGFDMEFAATIFDACRPLETLFGLLHDTSSRSDIWDSGSLSSPVGYFYSCWSPSPSTPPSPPSTRATGTQSRKKGASSQVPAPSPSISPSQGSSPSPPPLPSISPAPTPTLSPPLSGASSSEVPLLEQ